LRQLYTARRTLARWTKMAASARHNNSSDLRPAAKTLLPFSPVHLVVLLIIARYTLNVNKIGNRRPAHLNRFAQNFLQSFQQNFYFR
jgi:hypothetical protein